MSSTYIDLTFPLSANLPSWPGSIGISVTTHMKMPIDINNLTSVSIDCHLGTHLDAPLHFVDQGKSVEQIELNKCIGPAYVVEIYGRRAVSAADLQAAAIPAGCTRLLLKTDNQSYWLSGETRFQEDFCALDASAAEWLVQHGFVLVGIDYLSIQRFHDGPDVHQLLLQAEVVIVETLNLQQVSTGWYDFICLPIKLAGVEGAPVRAIAKPVSYDE